MVAARYLPFMGGIEAHVHEVARRMAARGHEVTILTTDPAGQLATFEREGSIQTVRVRAWPKSRDYYFAPGIVRQILNGGWDVVHVQGYHTLVPPMAMWAAIRRRVPFVLTFHSGGHSSRLRKSLRGVQYRVLAPFVRRAAQLIGVSEFEADFFSRAMGEPRERFAVVPNGSELIAIPGEPFKASDQPLIVSIGRLERYKGHHRVIEALPDVLAQIPAARLRVLGEGAYKHELLALVQRLGLGHRVEIGGIPIGQRAEMSKILSQAALIVLLSDYEAHPVSVMEAVALRRPVLVTDCSGLGEIAKQGYANAIPLGATKEETAKAIVDEIRCPRAASGVVLPNWDDCTDRLLEIYDRSVAKARGVRPESMAAQHLRHGHSAEMPS